MEIRTRHRLLIFSVVMGMALALASAASMVGRARAVEVVGLFAGAFGAGAGVVAAVHELRAARSTHPTTSSGQPVARRNSDSESGDPLRRTDG